MNRSFTACLLAGGKSSRMGRDKAAMSFGGVPLWQRQVATLRHTGADEILISGRPDASYAVVGIRVIEDEIKESGPLSGVAAVLAAAAHPLVLVLAVDMPLMTVDYLHGLLAKALDTGMGVVPEQNSRYEGLAAIYPKAAHELATLSLRGRDPSMQHFIAACVVKNLVVPIPIATDESPLFQNMNTPGEHARITLESASLPSAHS